MSLHPGWFAVIHVDNYMEDSDFQILSHKLPYAMLGLPGRNFIKKFGKPIVPLMPYGFTGQICRLYERYIMHVIRSFRDPIDLMHWNEIWQDVYSKKLLIVAVCLQFVCKVYDFANSPDDTRILQLLHAYQEDFSIDDIGVMQNHLITTIGLRLPVWHNVLKAEKFAYELGYRNEQVKAIATVSEAFDLFLAQLNQLVTSKTEMKSYIFEFDTLFNFTLCYEPYIRSGPLAAAAVVAAIVHLDYSLPDTIDSMNPIEILANMSFTSPDYIRLVSACMLVILNEYEAFTPDFVHNDAIERMHIDYVLYGKSPNIDE